MGEWTMRRKSVCGECKCDCHGKSCGGGACGRSLTPTPFCSMECELECGLFLRFEQWVDFRAGHIAGRRVCVCVVCAVAMWVLTKLVWRQMSAHVDPSRVGIPVERPLKHSTCRIIWYHPWHSASSPRLPLTAAPPPPPQENKCVKRPMPPTPCRLGCGFVFSGKMDRFEVVMEEMEEHEREMCPKRIVTCDFEG